MKIVRRSLLAFSGVLLALSLCGNVYGQTPDAAKNDSGTQTGPPAHPATEDQIREYMSLIRAEKVARETMDQSLKTAQIAAAPYYPASFWDDMRAAVQKVDIVGAYVTVYQRYMSQEQMQAVIDFYRSPAGQTLLRAQPLAIRDAQAIVRQQAGELGRAVELKHQAEIEAAKKKYEAGQGSGTK